MANELVLRVIIEASECAPLGERRLDWVVRTRIDTVISGDFAGDRFAFRVHSPARAGLEVGKRCVVTATAVEGGYAVDENQWRGSPHRDER